MSVEKKNIPGYLSLLFIAAYCAFLIILCVLSVKEHGKAKRDYLVDHFGRASDSKEVQEAYQEKDKEKKSTKRNRFYIDDDGRIQKYPVYESE